MLDGFERESYTAGDICHDIYRKGDGPAVIVMAEIPGITPKVVAFAERVAGRGFTVVLPHLFGTPGREPSGRYAAGVLARVCVAREFGAFAVGHSTPVMEWLRSLARHEHERCGGPGVGAVGMCFTGGFALAMAVDDEMVAPVLSQPSLPLPVGRSRRRDIQLSERDWAAVQRRVRNDGLCVMGLRFSEDRAVPDGRFATLREKLGDGFIAVELDSSPGNPYGHPRSAHSVLTEHLQDREGTPTREALDRVLDFLSDRLSGPSSS